MSKTKNLEYIKIDNVFVCEIEDSRKLKYIEDEFEILNQVEEKQNVTLLFHVVMDRNVDKIVKHKLKKNELKLIKDEKLDNYIIFDFIFFSYIFEEDNKEAFENGKYEDLVKSFYKFREKLFNYRKGVVINKTFNVKQRRISRKQLNQMQLDFEKWDTESIF